jgi:hypothetical protein
MNTQVTQIHSSIVKLRRAIGTNPEAELAADAFFLDYAQLLYEIDPL